MLKLSSKGLSGLLVAGAFVAGSPAARADTLIAYSLETRMQIDLAVPDAPLKALIPAGWEGNVATTGAAKDANIRLIFVDQIPVAAPDGNPAPAGGHPRGYTPGRTESG